MPIYKWTGVDYSGQTLRGRMAADSVQQLDGLLFKRQIALIRADHVSSVFLKPPTVATRIRFFQQCSVMLRSGITVSEALTTLAHAHEQDLVMQLLIRSICLAVQSGIPLYAACSSYPDYFDAVTIAMIRAGEQSGALAQAMAALAHRLEMQSDFVSRFRSAMTVPAITVLFFVAACAIIFGAILPSFATLFAASYDRLPVSTRVLFTISSWCNLTVVYWILAVLAVALLVVKKTHGALSDRLKRYLYVSIVQLPWLGRTLTLRYWLHFFESAGILLQQSVLLVPALRIASQAVTHPIIAQQLRAVEHDVAQGLSLHDALALHVQGCDSVILTMIATGEHVAQLPQMISYVCQDLKAVLVTRITRMSMIVQPVLLVCLGLLVAFLLFSVYVPLISICGTF